MGRKSRVSGFFFLTPESTQSGQKPIRYSLLPLHIGALDFRHSRSVVLLNILTSLSMKDKSKDKSSSSAVEERFPLVASTLSLVGARNVGGGGGNIGKPLSTIIPSPLLLLCGCVCRHHNDSGNSQFRRVLVWGVSFVFSREKPGGVGGGSKSKK